MVVEDTENVDGDYRAALVSVTKLVPLRDFVQEAGATIVKVVVRKIVRGMLDVSDTVVDNPEPVLVNVWKKFTDAILLARYDTHEGLQVVFTWIGKVGHTLAFCEVSHHVFEAHGEILCGFFDLGSPLGIVVGNRSVAVFCMYHDVRRGLVVLRKERLYPFHAHKADYTIRAPLLYFANAVCQQAKGRPLPS